MTHVLTTMSALTIIVQTATGCAVERVLVAMQILIAGGGRDSSVRGVSASRPLPHPGLVIRARTMINVTTVIVMATIVEARGQVAFLMRSAVRTLYATIRSAMG